MLNLHNAGRILLLSSFLLALSNVPASASEGNWFKPGFLLEEPGKRDNKPTVTQSVERTPRAIVPAEPLKAVVKIDSQPASKAMEVFQPKYDPENQKTMWGEPSLYGPESYKKVCEFVTNAHRSLGNHFDELEKYLEDLFSPKKDLSELACLSHPSFYKFLEFFYQFNYYAWLQGIETPDMPGCPVNKLPYMMQALVDRVIQTRFHYMNTLLPEEKARFREKFLVAGSNDDYGEFVFASELHMVENSYIKPIVRMTPDDDNRQFFQFKYYTQMTANQGKIYHLYLLDNDSGPLHRTAVSLPGHPSIGAYQHPYNEFTHNIEGNDGFYRGFLLDKRGRPIEKPGIIITQSWKNSAKKDYVMFVYAKDPFFDQMCFYEKLTVKEEESLPSSPLLDMAGGIEALNRDKILFLPYPSTEKESEIHPFYAEFLLPYAQHLYLEWTESGAPTEQITSLIEKLEASLLEDSLQKDDPTLVQECALEIAAELFNQKVEEKSDIIFNNYKKPQQPGKTWEKRKRREAKEKATKQVRTEAPQPVTPEMIRERRKMKALDSVVTR